MDQKLPEGLVKHRMSPCSGNLEWGLRAPISNKFLGDAVAADWVLCFRVKCTDLDFSKVSFELL